jgi:5,10-methylenetetrahydromethanopterin reductase
VIKAVRDHPLFEGHGHEHAYADANFSLDQLGQVATDVVPDAYIRQVNATGSAAQVAAHLREYLDNGVDELILHGSSPTQLAPVLDELTTQEATR